MDIENIKLDNVNFHLPYIEGICSSWSSLLFLAEAFTVKMDNLLSNIQNKTSDFFYIESGLFQMRYYSDSGKIRCTTSFGKGTLINIAPAFLQDDVYLAGVYCLKEAKVWRFDGKILQDDDFIIKNVTQMREAFRQVSINLLIHSVYSTDMLIDTPKIRVAKFLLGLHNEKDKKETPLYFTQQEMADMLNLHRVTLARILQELKKEGLIDIPSRSPITIQNINELKMLAGFS